MKKIAFAILIALGGILISSYKMKMIVSRDIMSVLGINDSDIAIEYLECSNDPNCFIGPPSMNNLSTLKALAIGDKVSLVKEVFDYAKSYSRSEEFKTKYEKRRQELKPYVAVVSPEEREQALAMVKEQEEMYTPELLAMLPPDGQAAAKQALEDMKAQANGDLTADQKNQWEQLAPQNPNTSIKKMLENFLQVTENVDFNASTKLNPENKHLVFTNPAYERKDLQWKACYRAGPEVTNAARTYAQQWVTELN